MYKNIPLICCLLSLLLAQNASAFCDKIATRVYINTNPGNVKYITTRSRDEFLKEADQQVSPNTLGLTVSKLTITGKAKASVETLGKQLCASLGVLEFKMGYDGNDLRVYIDKKYPPNSCEYEVIKKHENYHVAVAQQAMTFFKPDVEKKIHEAISKLKPQVVHKEKEVERIVQEQFDQVMAELRPLLDHINKKIAEKNAAIDTPESYASTRALCQNW